jgi:hypothetical protein
VSEEFIEDLFDLPGNLNPENVEQVITKAYLNLHELKKAGCSFSGATGKYTRKKKWLNNPKLIVKTSDGKFTVNLKITTTPRASKFLIGVLYCLAWLDDNIKSANVNYNDQHGVVRGIASRHGPEKSDYMQSLIAKMNDENFMLELDGLIENPLPENLSEVQISILDATNVGTVSEDEVKNLMDTHECSATDILREYERLKVIMEDDNRVPNSINFPQIGLLEHENIMDTQTMRQEIHGLKSTNKDLQTEVETIKEELLEAQNETKRLLDRGLIDRIFNRKR